MKLPVLLLAGSLAANAACAVVLALRPALAPSAVRDFFHLHDAAGDARLAVETRRRDDQAAKARAAAEAASRGLLWSALDSADLNTLVAHLRAAGFSPVQVRAIVSARVDARFDARRREITGAASATPYWKAEVSGMNSNPKVYEALNQVYRDRTRTLREVLGADFFADALGDATAEERRQFGDLPKAKIDQIQRIVDDYAEMTSQLRAGMQGITLPEDREKLALLEREKRADLAAILSPEELLGYEMRTSTIGSRLRPILGIMDATEEEFRTIFAIQQSLADRLYPPGGSRGAEMSRQRQAAEQESSQRIAAALGPSRAADYARASDYEYQAIYRLAQQENLPADAASRAYDLRAATAAESRRIAESTTLDPAAKLAALQALAQSTKVGLIGALGTTAGDAYAKSADWLKLIANGGSIGISPSGGSIYYLAPSNPPPGK